MTLNQRKLMDRKMECKSRMQFRGCLALLLVLVLIWSYGKTESRFAQVSQEASVENEAKQGQNQVEAEKTTTRSSVDLKVTAPAQSKGSSDSAAVTRSETTSDTTSSGDAEEPGIERGPIKSNIEPDLPEETYNQVRAKKPAIPSQFDGANQAARQRNVSSDPVSFLGLLGIPTLVFSVLFFVMWGVISVKIQRIMF